MHTEARQYCERFAHDGLVVCLDLGGQDVNGSVHDLWPNAKWTVVDIVDGPGVDIVANAAYWSPDKQYDMVISTELFEHTPLWFAVIDTAYKALKPGGVFIVTCAGPRRTPHSATGTMHLFPADEHYENIDPEDLDTELVSAGFIAKVEHNERAHDVYAYCYK